MEPISPVASAVVPPIVRTLAGLAVAFGAAWLGGLILGEYPFTGFLPVLGGFLLGVTVVGAAAFVEGGDPPKWAIVAASAFAVWGEWRAAWIDAGGIGPLPTEAWYAMAAAALGGLFRLVPPPGRARGAAASDAPDEADEAGEAS